MFFVSKICHVFSGCHTLVHTLFFLSRIPPPTCFYHLPTFIFPQCSIQNYLYWESFRPSPEAMATHSSSLAWRIPWTEEPGRLQSMGALGVGHDWATSLSLVTFMHWRRKWQPSPVFLPGESQGRGAWRAAVSGVAQSWTRLKQLSSRGFEPEVPFPTLCYPDLDSFMVVICLTDCLYHM